MRPLILPATKNTPDIVLDPAGGDFRFTGLSIPENASAFYEPVIHWMRAHTSSLPNGTTFIFDLPYFNSSSLKAIYLVLNEIKKALAPGRHFPVMWMVEEDDEFMNEAAETFSDMLDMPLVVMMKDQAA